MKQTNIISITCAIILFLGKLFAQTPIYENYTTEDGLISDFVYCVFQDSKGSIWIGTDDGVSNYDGNIFTNYSLSDGLCDNEILKIFEDKQGRVWFLGFNGKVCFYKQKKSIINQIHHGLKISIQIILSLIII